MVELAKNETARLDAFAAQLRAECDAALARLDTVDVAALPPDLRSHFDEVRQGWESLRTLTENGVVAVHEAACLHAAES